MPPVDGPVVDPFRPPPGPYGPGNRGLEYDTEPGAPVRASAAGTVVFAGPVAGSRHVTVRHADGVRTSYSYLATISVALGQRVEQGDRLGTAGERLHFGARMGDAYFDPALLFGADPVAVELVPFEIPPGSSPAAERDALLQLALGESGPGLPGPGDVTRWLRDRAATAAHYASRVPATGALAAVDLGRRLLFPGPCSDEPPPRRPAAAGPDGRHRVAITVAGLGSSSTTGSIDELRTAELGYDDERVVRFSYTGGKVPGTGAAIDVPARDYTSADTQGDLRVAGRRLADLVVAVLAAEPAATVDLLAHSQGGVVARLALLDLADRGARRTADGARQGDRDADRGAHLERIGILATIGTPHRGADLATAVVAANGRPVTNWALDRLEDAVGTGIDPDALAVAQLAETSELVAELRRRGVPDGVPVLSVAARGDWVVAAPNTVVPGATNVTVPVIGRDAHGDLVAADATTDALARALAGRPPACESAGDVVADVLVGHGLSAVEDAAGAAVSVPTP
ncbi:MAG TPA: peptidoglycan DD-metalloendopeptidase family protein [Acidimicrobiales bacterium]